MTQCTSRTEQGSQHHLGSLLNVHAKNFVSRADPVAAERHNGTSEADQGYFVSRADPVAAEQHNEISEPGQGYLVHRADPVAAVPHDQECKQAQRAQAVSDDGAVGAHNAALREIYDRVVGCARYNHQGARVRVPSGLCIPAWQKYLEGYPDSGLVEFLEFGWPINYRQSNGLVEAEDNHPSALQHREHIDHYIRVELGFGALAGPFDGPPVAYFHRSPLMTRVKRDSDHRRVIMDLSWPDGYSINDGVDAAEYLDGPGRVKLPTSDYMVDRLLLLGEGAFMYKSDLARGYRQLRVDPWDWPLLGFCHEGKYYMDLCPPFGLRTAAMCMQRTSEAVCYVHGQRGFVSKPYLDDFGGAEADCERAQLALTTLQGIFDDLGLVEASHKVCHPAQCMVWLGIEYNSLNMTMKIPPGKMAEIGEILESWRGRNSASARQMQSLLGLLQFVASVSPPARVFTNRMLENLREAPKRGQESLSLGFKKDLKFFLDLWPQYNGIRIIKKELVECQEEMELDACLSGCGAYIGAQYYSEVFPEVVMREEHSIAHLELLNVVVAIKTWGERWRGKRVCVYCDNQNACLAMQSGRSRDSFMHQCVRELFLLYSMHDLEVWAFHRPGVHMQRADALSRAHLQQSHRDWIASDLFLQEATRVRVSESSFVLTSEL